MLPPSWLSWALISAKAIEDAGSEITGQLALADFIARGELDRHLRRMRQRYQQRQASSSPRWRASSRTGGPRRIGGGLHLSIALPAHLDEPAFLAAAARHGVGLEGLSLHSYTGDCPPGVVLGHGSMADPAIKRGIQLLATTVNTSWSSGSTRSARSHRDHMEVVRPG